MKVQLNRDWKHHSKGEILTRQDRPTYVLQMLIDEGYGELLFPKQMTRIPQDMPHRDRLLAEGVKTVEHVEQLIEDDHLTSIAEIGSRRATEIREFINDLSY